MHQIELEPVQSGTAVGSGSISDSSIPPITASGSSSNITAHSEYLVKKLRGQPKYLYGAVKFDVIARVLSRLTKSFTSDNAARSTAIATSSEASLQDQMRVLDVGCADRVALRYLSEPPYCSQLPNLSYCGLDYEVAFEPDVVADITADYQTLASKLSWQPDVIMALDVFEHLPDKEAVGRALTNLRQLLLSSSPLPSSQVRHDPEEVETGTTQQRVLLAIVPQMYRLDRFKFEHLYYPDHKVRATLEEWREMLEEHFEVVGVQGVGYLATLPYLTMFSRRYRDDNFWGKTFRWLRGSLLETRWLPCYSLDRFLTRTLGNIPALYKWGDSCLLVCIPKSSPN